MTPEARRGAAASESRGRRLWRWAKRILGGLVLLWLALILLYRWVDPPITPLMLLRWPSEGRILRHEVPLAAIARSLQRAVIVSEDDTFCTNPGIDWREVGDAIAEYRATGHLRGASTITMQTARNLFLWPGGGFLRKGAEAALALAIDALWPKKRVLEVYLNAIEWGPGIYGADAAARYYFHTDARALSLREAALLTAVLPNPRFWSAARPDGYIDGRARTIEDRVERFEGNFSCLR
ncbi:MAG TPA: monofunctional biosynthetic peptidoglycan transglycosylase [Alphaproteobacteria bacterium]|nr:monofunctional biosynthetic peptidoglycan transglycosylase [Alphaproteobacteria bacterium]